MSLSASSSSCLSKKAASGRPRSWSAARNRRPHRPHPAAGRAAGQREASETARRYTFADGVGEIGIIAPVSQAFCGACSRVRLTSDGKIRTCLFSQVEHDLYGRMRAGASDAELAEYIFRTVQDKEARHHIGEPGFLKPSRSMVHIGG